MLASAGGFAVHAQTSATPPPAAAPQPSAIGAEAVDGIAVSPQYMHSGVVVVMSHLMQCSQDCVHLWVTRDRGASWTRAGASGWQHGIPRITVDGGGREVLFAAGTSSAQRSDDLGATWHDLPAAGNPSPSMQFARDQTVAIAGSSDHVIAGTSVRAVRGSGGNDSDVFFAMAPAYPSAGRFAPVLLGASDSHATPLVMTCSAQFSCSSNAVALGNGGAFEGPPSLALSTAYGADGVAFALIESGIYKSTDGGMSFKPLVLPVPPAQATGTTGMALAPGYRESSLRTLYVSVQQIAGSGGSSHSAGDVYRSDDGGTTWHRFGPPSPLDGGATAVAVAPDGRVFAGYFSLGRGGAQDGLLCGDGRTWQALCSRPVSANDSKNSAVSGESVCAGVSCAAATPTTQPGGAGAGREDATGPGAGGGRGAAVDASAQSPGARPGSGAVWRYPLAAVALVLLGVALFWRRRAAPGS